MGTEVLVPTMVVVVLIRVLVILADERFNFLRYLLVRLSHEIRDLLEHFDVVVWLDERHALAFVARSPSPANSVHIVFDALRHIVVHDESDVPHIQSS